MYGNHVLIGSIKISDITNSYEVIGVYQSLKKEYLHERVQKLEQQINEIQVFLQMKTDKR
jgi:hypothetical protein